MMARDIVGCSNRADMISLPSDFTEDMDAENSDDFDVLYTEVSTEVHRRLFELADWMLCEAPWKKMTNRHSFVIVDPVSGEQQMAAVMGNGGDIYGFHLYLPDEGARWFSQLMRDGQTNQLMHEAQFEQRMLELAFSDGLDDVLDEYDHDLDDDFAPEGWNDGVGPQRLLYAQFRAYQPGCPPWHPKQAEAERLLSAMEVFKHYYLTHFPNYSGLLFAPDNDSEPSEIRAELPVLRLRKGGDAEVPAHWECSLETYTAPASKPLATAPADDVFTGRMAKHRVRPKTVWEIGAIYLPRPVFEDEGLHYAVLAFVGDRTDGKVLGITSARANDCRFTLMRRCLEKAAADCGHLPSGLVVGSPVAETALADVAESCCIGIMRADDPSEMQLFHELTSSLLESDALGTGPSPLTEISEDEAMELKKLLERAPGPDATAEESLAFIESVSSNPKTKKLIEQFMVAHPEAMELLDESAERSHITDYTPPTSRHRYVFRVDLYGAKPPIWRRITLPDDATFFDLHLAIQAAFGWSGYHLHGFQTGDRYPDSNTVIDWAGEDDEFMMFGVEKRHELETRLKDIFGPMRKKLRYTYDFGDSWEHTIKLEKEIADTSTEPVEPFEVIKGRGGDPVEDCGGVWGLMQIIDGTHPDCDELPADRLKEIRAGQFDINEVYPRDAGAEMGLLDEMHEFNS